MHDEYEIAKSKKNNDDVEFGFIFVHFLYIFFSQNDAVLFKKIHLIIFNILK